jgi:hypothetical protein
MPSVTQSGKCKQTIPVNSPDIGTNKYAVPTLPVYYVPEKAYSLILNRPVYCSSPYRYATLYFLLSGEYLHVYGQKCVGKVNPYGTYINHVGITVTCGTSRYKE